MGLIPYRQARDAVGRDNLKCLRCGYLLSGLEASTRCPECGLEIAATVAGPELRNADSRFLHRISIGVTGLLGGMTLWGLVYVVRLVAQLFEVPAQRLDYWLNHVALIGWTAKWLSALLLGTTRQPWAGRGYESPISLRKLVLYSAITLMVLHIVPVGFLMGLEQYRFYGAVFTLIDNIAAMILLLYVFRLGTRGGDAFLNRNYPFALAAMAAAMIFNFVLWYVWRGFLGSTLSLLYAVKVGAIGYVALLMFRMRQTLLSLLPDEAHER